MAPRFNPIIAKKGKTRQVLKRPAYLKPKKKANWQRVPYVRDPEAVKQVRGDRDSWKRSLPELLTCSPRALVELLRKDGLLPRLEGPVCPRCQHGTLRKLAPQRQGSPPKHRCNAKNCQAYISPHYAHPLFVDHWGKSHTPLSTQAALLLLLLNRVPHAAIHRLMYVNHKAIEDMQKRLYTLREAYVLEKEKEICFGRGHEWADVEADEATFAKKIVQGQVQWEQWCGIVQRGKPGTLVLHRLKPPLAALRAPGPGAVRKVEWKPIAKKWLEGKNVILHTDSAKSYRAQVPGMLHDRVVHKKTRVKVGNKFRWVAPKYVEVQKHRLPGGKVMQVKSGTQIVDRCWRFLKERVTLNQQACVGARMLCMQLRSGQYEYWNRGKDLWTCTGALVQWYLG